MDDIEKYARDYAISMGHKNPDEEIVCVGGARYPVWKFFRDEAAEQLMRDQAASWARQAKAADTQS